MPCWKLCSNEWMFLMNRMSVTPNHNNFNDNGRYDKIGKKEFPSRSKGSPFMRINRLMARMTPQGER